MTANPREVTRVVETAGERRRRKRRSGLRVAMRLAATAVVENAMTSESPVTSHMVRLIATVILVAETAAVTAEILLPAAIVLMRGVLIGKILTLTSSDLDHLQAMIHLPPSQSDPKYNNKTYE